LVSTHSATEISKRAIKFFDREIEFENFGDSQQFLFKRYLKTEYETIPEKERIGKGLIYISKVVAKALYKFLKKKHLEIFKKSNIGFDEFVLKIIEVLEMDSGTLPFAIYLTSNLALDNFDITLEKIKKWASHDDWIIRECAGAPLVSSLKKNKQKIFKIYKEWVKSEDINLRRIVAETLRPLAVNKWLRDPAKNDEVLEILTQLNHDESVYVRKSVGNNLKDLTKYMPKKILKLIENWLKEKDKLKIKEQNNLIWTIYQALRWLKDRNPEFHPWIERLVGKNYILYFDEKRNRNALPPNKKKR